MYHPHDPSEEEKALGCKDAEEFEFLELFNFSNDMIDLKGMRIVDGIRYQHFISTKLRPSELVVLARNPRAFLLRYGKQTCKVLGPYSGHLKNSRESIRIIHTDGKEIEEVVHLTYQDSEPWPTTPDGDGYSLTLTTITSKERYRQSYWKPSDQVDGTPGECSLR